MENEPPSFSDRTGTLTCARRAVEGPQRPPIFSHKVPAWVLSLILHITLLVALSVMVRVARRGAHVEPARGGGIVLAHQVDGEATYFGQTADSATAATSSPESAALLAEVLPGNSAPPVDLDSSLPDASLDTSGAEMGLSLPSADGLAQQLRPARGGDISGEQAKTSIFGAEGVGTKFVYVFDRSASMAGYQGRPIAAAKRELNASLQDLDKVHQFQIIFYNDRVTVFNPFHPEAARMLFGDVSTKRLAEKFVRGIVATGGTEHMAALKLAIGMAPDVIFFLTDAAEPQLTPQQLNEIRRKNNRVRAVINAIEFGAGPSQGRPPFLEQLASQNGGTCIYVDITRLPPK